MPRLVSRKILSGKNLQQDAWKRTQEEVTTTNALQMQLVYKEHDYGVSYCTDFTWLPCLTYNTYPISVQCFTGHLTKKGRTPYFLNQDSANFASGKSFTITWFDQPTEDLSHGASKSRARALALSLQSTERVTSTSGAILHECTRPALGFGCHRYVKNACPCTSTFGAWETCATCLICTWYWAVEKARQMRGVETIQEYQQSEGLLHLLIFGYSPLSHLIHRNLFLDQLRGHWP